MRMTPDIDESVRCTVSGCSCVCFKPGGTKLRSCDRCGHGWVAHALEKLQAQPSSSCGPVEVALPGLVFDLSSLVLYGAQAIPVRLKILLDRLYSILTPEQVSHILHTLGWNLGDYVRGYMLQSPSGKVLDRWMMVTPEEELLILKQFLRFGETRPIVELMTLQCLAAVNHLSDPELKPAPKTRHSNISTFIEHNRGTLGTFRKSRGDSRLVAGVCRFEKSSLSNHDDTVHPFENFPGGLSLLLPFHFPSSTFQCLVPPTKDLVPPTKFTQCLQKPSGTKLAERYRQDGGRGAQENDPILQQSKGELALKIKADPDKPNPGRSLWHPNPCVHSNQGLDLHRVLAKQENTTSVSPPLNNSFIPTSSSPHPSISSTSSASPPKIYQKLQGSSPTSFHPLPSFSSSFLCPLPTSSFSSTLHGLPPSSSSLHPLPSSPCSLPSTSTAGGRKGRVCCGVCGKSFYDKGTLKIHYNAVHLKIKHRCTVAGCTMVFSSLRSRNRHSANPNPRLHTGASRDAHTHRNTHSEPHCGHCGEEETAESLSKMSKAEILRGFVTERLAAASQEILAVVDRIVAGYEEEASGFRQEIGRQKRQLEVLLQPRVKLDKAGVKRSRSFGHVEEEEGEDEGDQSPENQEDLNNPVPPRNCSFSNHMDLRIRILEDPRTEVLSKNVLKKCPMLRLKCPRGLLEAEFLDLLRSTFPQLAGDNKPFDILTSNKRRRLQHLKLKTVTAEEIHRKLSCAGWGTSTVFIRLKTQKEAQAREEEIHPLQTKDDDREDSSSTAAMLTPDETQRSSCVQEVEGRRVDALSIGSTSLRDMAAEEADDEGCRITQPSEDSVVGSAPESKGDGSGDDDDDEKEEANASDADWKPVKRDEQ
ncbi:zinc finger protein basonuclin-2-like protein, partial [Lates japonicus]